MQNIPINQQNIVAVLGIENLPNERKIEILEKVTNLVQERLLVKVYDSLDGRFQEELGELLENGNPEKLSEFLEKHAPQLPELIEQETAQIKIELSQWVKTLE